MFLLFPQWVLSVHTANTNKRYENVFVSQMSRVCFNAAMTRKRTFLRKTKKVTSPKKSVNSSERYLLQFLLSLSGYLFFSALLSLSVCINTAITKGAVAAFFCSIIVFGSDVVFEIIPQDTSHLRSPRWECPAFCVQAFFG